MPEKSVREMSYLERKSHSLEAKTFHAVVFGSVLLGIVLLIVGIGLYSLSLTMQYVGQAYYLSQYAAMSATHGVDASALVQQIMERYRSLGEEEKALIGTQEYREFFREFQETNDYDVLIHMFPAYAHNKDVANVYIAGYDEETGVIVYVVDPKDDNPFYPGEFEHVSAREIQRFLAWDGEGMLYNIVHKDQRGWMCTSGTPIITKQGELCGFVLADVTIGNVLHGMISYAVQITLSLVAAMVAMAWVMIRHMKKNLVEPIKEITSAAQGYVNGRKEGSLENGIFAKMDIHTGDEVEELSLVMADMERDLVEYEDNLTKITAEKERIGTELELATRIQADMLPNIFPAFPERKEFDIYASMAPAKEVGGDFYDFFLVDEDHLCMVIADVSGKGVPAALFMMASKIILANNAKLGKTPAQILASANQSICSNNREEMFVTVWLGILELSTGKLTAANAGHEYPVLKKPDGPFALHKDKHGFVIGGMVTVKYREYEMVLEPGSKLFVYTDGVPEATNADNQMFGIERMLETLNKEPDAAPEKILKNVRKDVDEFVKDAEQFDDLTMLCMEYKGNDTQKT